MLKESSEMLTGNDRFEGFVIDIIDEISKLLGFNYIVQMVYDNNYGNLNQETGMWDGMIKELLDGVLFTSERMLLLINQPPFCMQKADLAIADLSISYEREQVVDFTMPFMNTGEFDETTWHC